MRNKASPNKASGKASPNKASGNGEVGKDDIVRGAAQDAGLTQEATDRAFEAIFGFIRAKTDEGKKVTVRNFGSFMRRRRRARPGRNPATGESIDIQASNQLAFKPSPKLKQRELEA